METIKITILLTNENIKITREKSSQIIIISLDKKSLNAKDVYDFLSFDLGITYDLEKKIIDDCQSKPEEQNLLDNVFDLFKKIIDELNNYTIGK